MIGNPSLYKAGLIVNIVFGVIGGLSFLGVGIRGLTDSSNFFGLDSFSSILSATGILNFQGSTNTAYIVYLVVAIVLFFGSVILSGIALHLLRDLSKPRTRVFGIMAGIWGIFATPIFIGGILTLVGMFSNRKSKNSSARPESQGGGKNPPSTNAYRSSNDDGYTPRDTGI